MVIRDFVGSIRMWFELLIVILGTAFGFLRRGKESKLDLLIWGVIIGIIPGILFGLIAFFIGGITVGFLGALGVFIQIIIYVIVFIIGVFIGDFFEGHLRK